jgi:hypothetical protein
MTRTNKSFSILLVLGILLVSSLPACKKETGNAGVDKKEVDGLTTKTFYNESGNIEVTLATDGTHTIVAVPKAAAAIGRQNQMGPEEQKCLAKCVKIEDSEKRLNCVLLCPVGRYQVFTF